MYSNILKINRVLDLSLFFNYNTIKDPIFFNLSSYSVK